MASHNIHHDHVDADPGLLYETEWAQKLIRQIQHCLQSNISWLHIEPSEPRRILDFACGNGTVSSSLLNTFPKAVFQGLDIATSQVQRFNDEAARLLGGTHDRMFAIQGDLSNPSPSLSMPEWSTFDIAIISMALHHVKDPRGTLESLRQRVRPGGMIVVVDFLRQSPKSLSDHDAEQHGEADHKYDVADMVHVPQGPEIWPGFSILEMHSNMTAVGCIDVDILEYSERIEGPQGSKGYDKMFMLKARVV